MFDPEWINAEIARDWLSRCRTEHGRRCEIHRVPNLEGRRPRWLIYVVDGTLSTDFVAFPECLRPGQGILRITPACGPSKNTSLQNAASSLPKARFPEAAGGSGSCLPIYQATSLSEASEMNVHGRQDPGVFRHTTSATQSHAFLLTLLEPILKNHHPYRLRCINMSPRLPIPLRIQRHRRAPDYKHPKPKQ